MGQENASQTLPKGGSVKTGHWHHGRVIKDGFLSKGLTVAYVSGTGRHRDTLISNRHLISPLALISHEELALSPRGSDAHFQF